VIARNGKAILYDTVIGKQMQFFGARANLAKTLLYAITLSKSQYSSFAIIRHAPKTTIKKLPSQLDRVSTAP
ncbi:hypothetical protein O5165_25525, partial [Escherichia coli]|nr:hypothetical protein [Escherichia coli]